MIFNKLYYFLGKAICFFRELLQTCAFLFPTMPALRNKTNIKARSEVKNKYLILPYYGRRDNSLDLFSCLNA